jgi:beta-lactamase regulating signal transducer with metallopeptidase domain
MMPGIPVPIANALGWALVHSLWQAVVVAGAAAVAMHLLRRRSPQSRYAVACTALLLMIAMPVATAWRAYEKPGPRAGATEIIPSSTAAEHGSSGAGTADLSAVASAKAEALTRTDSEGVTVDRYLPFIVLAWLVGVLSLSARLIAGWMLVERLRRRATRALGVEWQTRLRRISARVGVSRPVRFLESALVDVPTVVGCLRPVILMPVSTLSGLSPQQIEAILAHELAHIRRFDYLANLLQTAIETLLFYHPAVWWMSHRVRIEREHCCDDVAVRTCGDAEAYAGALADLEELRRPLPQPASFDMLRASRVHLAATGGSLIDRIGRLLGASPARERFPVALAGLAAALVVTVVVIVPGVAPAIAQADKAKQPAATAAPRTPKTDRTIRRALPPPSRATTPPVLEDDPDDFPPTPPEPPDAPLPPEPPFMPDVAAPPVPPAMAAPPAPPAPFSPPVPPAPPASTWPQPPVPPAPSGVPVPPAPPAFAMPPAPPAPPNPFVYEFNDDRQFRSNWRENGRSLDVRGRGDVELTDDDADVKSITPGGYVSIKERVGSESRRYEVRAVGAGIERAWFVNGRERPIDADARAWLARMLPDLARRQGLGATSRVRRILQQKGPSGVLDEITRIPSSFVKRVYFTKLFESGKVDAATMARALTQAGKEIESAFELASLLASTAKNGHVSDASVRKAYLAATGSIQSDFEHRRAMVAFGPVMSQDHAPYLESAQRIESDFELAELLKHMFKSGPPSAAQADLMWKLLESMQSDFERRRVLTALMASGKVPAEIVAAALDSTSRMQSDFERAHVLMDVARTQPVDGTLRAPYFKAVGAMKSDFERGRVLKMLAKQSSVSQDVVVDVLRATEGMSSGFEAAGVLMSVAAVHRLDGATRDAYRRAAERIQSSFEQNRALAALARQ